MMRERPKSSLNTIACAFIASIPRDEPTRNWLLPKSSKRCTQQQRQPATGGIHRRSRWDSRPSRSSHERSRASALRSRSSLARARASKTIRASKAALQTPGTKPSSSSLVTPSGRPFLNKVNGGRFSIHQQEAAPFEIFHYVIAPSRSKLALVLRHQTMQAVQFFADFLPQGVLGVTTWHLVNPLIVQTAARLGELFLDDEG